MQNPFFSPLVLVTFVLLSTLGCDNIDLKFENLSSSQTQSVEVVPVYDSYSQWSDLIGYTDPNLPRFRQTSIQVCDSAYLTAVSASLPTSLRLKDIYPCIHAGKMRMVKTSMSSCAGLSAEDALKAFEWTCDESSGLAVFLSSGFKSEKGLRDLLDSSLQFSKNSISVKNANGDVVYQSQQENWWPNETIVDISDDLQSATADVALSSPKKIYVISKSVAAPHSMMIYADNVTLVTLKSVKINYTGVSTSVYLSGKNFAWLEVAIEASTTNVGAGGLGIVHLDNTMGTMVRNSMIRNSSVSPIISIGLMMNSSRFNMVSNIFAERNQYGFKALNSSYNSLMGLEVSQYGDGTSYGVYLDSSSYNDLFKGQIENTGLLGTGLSIKSLSVHNRFVDYHVKGSSSGVSIVGGSGSPTGNTFTQTTQSSSYIGVILSAGVTGNEFNGLNIANNSTQGLLIQGATANTFYHLDVNSNTMDGIYLSDGIANKFVDLKSYNNGYSGIALYKNTQGSSRNTFIKALAANNGVSGVNCIHSSCSNNLFHQMTVKSNYQSGFKIGGTQNTISQTFVADNKDYGIYFDSWASSNNLAQLLVLGNEVSDINALNTAQDTYALTNVIYSQGSQISFTGTDSGTHTYSQVLSYSGLGNATGVFSISKPFVNETTSLPYRYSEIETDQVWFSVSTSYPWDYFGQSTDPRSNCSLSEACRIYSAAIENNNIFHNTSLNSVSNGLDNVNGDNSSKIAINGGGCTGDMETEAIFQDGLFNPSYLVNATEILDSTGDGDGLCESGENCVFLNHFGLFQGIGVDKSKYCVATNGQKIYQPLLLGGSSSFTIDKTTSGDRDPMVEIFNSGAQGSSEGGFVESIYNLYINNLESNSSSSTSWYVN